MTRIQLSTSISPETRRKLDELVQHYGTPREVVTVAIDRLYQRSGTDSPRMISPISRFCAITSWLAASE